MVILLATYFVLLEVLLHCQDLVHKILSQHLVSLLFEILVSFMVRAEAVFVFLTIHLIE